MGLAILAVVPNSMQSWVGSSKTQTERRSRITAAVLANASLGLISGLTFALLAPFAATLIFSGAISVGYTLSSVCGFIIFLTCTSRSTGSLGLVALGRIGSLTTSALVGAVVGVALILTLGASAGAIGALWGVAIAECFVLTIQLAALRRGGEMPKNDLHV
jgi:hypothetical protein